MIGGASDKTSTNTLKTVNIYQVRNGEVCKEPRADMLISRSSHGCTVNLHKNEIYVAGGYFSGNLTRSCEAYLVKDNAWREL